MGLQAEVHLGHVPWALAKEEEEEEVLFPPLIISYFSVFVCRQNL
jgi:hypothetical protein